ncbi:Subtilase family protein [Anaerovirgula multivorans]|uniref:Subtilase family protein n=1 Tax=Anaerovirgula multivorans TaxID=312168 RepID=A0A239GE02_9FIRM|nr:S8 family serine peptidase [Anaerovirgula multivorans]SNS67536.1 Subtilase family protein [Anaerovirgula multivorans]
MKKVVAKCMIMVLFCCSLMFNFSVQVFAGESDIPFKIYVDGLKNNNEPNVIISVNEPMRIFIFDEEANHKLTIYDHELSEKELLPGILLNHTYRITATTANGDFYTGLFSIYDKQGSDVVGALLDVNRVEQSMHTNDDTDYDRMVKSTKVYEMEKNDSFKTANKLFDSVIYGQIGTKSDKDFFQTMFYEEGDAIFVLQDIPAGKDFDIYVFDANKKQIASSCSTNSIETITIKEVTPNQWYYVQVIGYNGSFDKDNYYALSVKHQPKKTVEYGHSFETAKVATLLNEIPGEILFKGDSNFFKFTPPEDGIYSIYTKGTTDTYGYLYDQNKNQIAANDDKPNDLYGNFEIRNELKANTLYFIEVRHYGIGTGKFSLNIKKDEEEPIDTTFNNYDNPTEIVEGRELEISLPTIDSQYWLAFTPDTTGSCLITTTGDIDTYGVLFDDTKENIIMENDGVFGEKPFVLANTFIKEQTYYIKITGKEFKDTQNIFNAVIERLDMPNDPSFAEQWGLLNPLNGLDANVIPAWKYSRGDGFNIGVADTGADYNHPDLVKLDLSLAYNFTHSMKDVFPTNEKTSSASARAGHGTHVAGIIGAETNNGEGISGVALEANLVPLKVLGSRLTDSDVYTGSIAAFVNAIEYCKENNIRILNCSFGGYNPAVSEQEAMLNATDILFVIAAGNDGKDLSINPEYPACYYHDNSLVVAALNQYGELASFSNYGGPTDIAAAGEMVYSTFPNNQYTYSSGTSMATPYVTAISSLIWANNKGLTATDIKAIVTNKDNVTTLNSLNGKVLSGGSVNAFKAIVSDYSSVSSRRIASLPRDIFGRDVKATIKYYKDNAEIDEKTDKIIVKFEQNVNIDEFIRTLSQEHNFDQIEEVDYLKLINAYVYAFSSVDEADKAVDIFNAYTEVIYAEPNYVREVN